jgi:hypothetical protein
MIRASVFSVNNTWCQHIYLILLQKSQNTQPTNDDIEPKETETAVTENENITQSSNITGLL